MLSRALLPIGLASALDLHLLPEKYKDKGGRCIDGTMSGFYYGAPPSSESDLWVFKMDGGGACNSKESCAKWAAKDNGKKGGSTNWATSKSANKKAGIVSDDPAINPDFYQAHKVWIPYCTGDGHSGQVVTPTSAQWGYYFSGHLNFELMVEYIFDNFPEIKSAKRVLLTGNSAGGIGTMNNCDFLQDKLASLGLSAKVSCAPKAGWFVPGFTDDQEDPELPPSRWENWSVGKTGGGGSGQFELQLQYVHEGCRKARSAEDVHKCGSATVAYPYIKAPMYVMENQYDPEQIFAQFGLPNTKVSDPLGQEFIAYFGRAMRNSTIHQIEAKSGDGLFLPSCLDHGDGLGVDPAVGTTKLKGFTSREGLADWFFGRGTVPAILVDDCKMASPGLPCNPTCTNVPGGGGGGGCEDAVRRVCADALSSVLLCEACAASHQSDMKEGGCHRGEIAGICSNIAGIIV